MSMYIPLAIVVLSNVFYHVSSKSTPENINPFASLTVTYFVGALASLVLYLIMNHGGNIIEEYKKLNWSPFILGLAIVGLEVGFIYMYKTGWNISTAQLVQSAVLAICLLIIGIIFYHEKISWTKIIGIVVCLGGLFLINK